MSNMERIRRLGRMGNSVRSTAGHATMFAWDVYPSHLCLAAFIDGYLDLIVYEKFSVYCTMMTGNLIGFGVSIGRPNDGMNSLFLFFVIITYLCGYYAMLYIFHFFHDDKSRSYLTIIPFQLCGVVVLYFASARYEAWLRYSLLPLVFSYGLLNCWAGKFGYTPGMMTGNFQKLVEALFKYAHLHASRSPRDNGDLIILALEVAGYLTGVVLAALLAARVSESTLGGPNASLLPMLLLIPVKIFLAKAVCVRAQGTADFSSPGVRTADAAAVHGSAAHHEERKHSASAASPSD